MPSAEKKLSRKAEIAASLRSQILAGQLKPGQRVIEPELAESFGASKTPVREALQELAAEGLVEVLPKKGYRIRDMDAADLLEILDLRAVLEAHAAALAARTADAEAVQRLRERWEAQCDASGLEPLERTLRARDFHAEISRIAHSGRLSAVLDGLHREMVRAHHVLPELRWHLAEDIELREHREILEAIAAGEPERSAQAMRTHLESILGGLGIAASEGDRS